MKILLELEVVVEGDIPDDMDYLELIGGQIPSLYTSEGWDGTDAWALAIESITLRKE
jgi:hypothetical protein